MALQAKPYCQQVSIRPHSTIDSNSYPYNIPAIQQLISDNSALKFHPDITFLVGENGSGKSTLLEAIALNLGFSAEGGTKNARFNTVEAASSQLHESIKMIKSFKAPRDGFFLRAESFFNVATYMENIGSNDAVYHQQSHGEAFLMLLTEKFRGKGLYLLDEPEAALSPTRQLAALSAMHQLIRNESQFIIATHSPILLAYPNAKIIMFDADGLREITYEQTEHFMVTRDFLNNHARRLQQLLAD